MKKSDLIFIFLSFLIWRISLFLFLFFAIKLIPLGENFLGGGRTIYLSNPWLWSWINFDGEHFLSIAHEGYKNLTYFFFPLYPKLIWIFGIIFGNNLNMMAIIGLIVSNLSFLIAIIGIWKLVKLDYKENISKLTIVLFLIFPTSFFFAAYYSESLFLALVIWSFYFARKEKWTFSLFLGIAAMATRLVGIALFLAVLPEFFRKKRYEVFLMPLGLIIYMFYLYQTTGDPLNFLNTVSIFGPQRSSTLILLPQVFYRYIFKILPNSGLNITPYAELIVAIIFSFLAVVSFLKMRLSYAIYLIIGFLIPTLSGSFSSLPRYVIVLFPAFILIATYLSKVSFFFRILAFAIMFIVFTAATMFFIRGVWIA